MSKLKQVNVSTWSLAIGLTVLVATIVIYVSNNREDVGISVAKDDDKCYDSSCGEVYILKQLEDYKTIKEEYRLSQVAEARKIEMDRVIAERQEKERLARIEAERLAEIERVKLAEIEAERKRFAKLQEEKAKREAEKNKQPVVASRGGGYQANYESTFFTAFCDTGCTGKTASGYDVSNTIYYQGLRIVAAPPNIPLYTKMRITFKNGSTMDAIVLDRGGAIKSKNIIDILVATKAEARQLGRQQVKVEIIM